MKDIIKTRSFIVIISIIFATQVYGQKRLYPNIRGGYGICLATNSTVASYSRNSTVESIKITDTYKLLNGNGSFGMGVQIGATDGFMFLKNIGAELNVGYLLAAKSTQTNHQVYSNNSYSYKNKMSGNMFRLTPSLKFFVAKYKLNPNMRFGLVMASNIKSKGTSINVVSPIILSSVSFVEPSYTGGVSSELSSNQTMPVFRLSWFRR